MTKRSLVTQSVLLSLIIMCTMMVREARIPVVDDNNTNIVATVKLLARRNFVGLNFFLIVHIRTNGVFIVYGLGCVGVRY